jgi:hypothetical protein
MGGHGRLAWKWNIATFLRKYRTFHEARAFVCGLKLRSRAEWVAFCHGEMPNLGQLPADIPMAASSERETKPGRGFFFVKMLKSIGAG